MAYTIEGRKSGVVRFLPDDTGTINTESESLQSRVTSNPIENGSDINDHVSNENPRLNLRGTIVGGDKAVAALKRMREKRDIVTYTGRTRITNLIFTTLNFDYSAKNKKGSDFRASLQQITITSAERVEVGEMPMMTVQDAGAAATPQARPTSNAGTQTTVTQNISSSAYASYVNSYRGDSNPGPASRATPSNSGVADR